MVWIRTGSSRTDTTMPSMNEAATLIQKPAKAGGGGAGSGGGVGIGSITARA
jgi:hypothetical protein